ncbi:hypothetical protein [Saccharothrix sp. Mg75]|uniref:hypothetical protein n=1 Tax=Saccharothrix sp. Mg75 TaxID=3445357 RepID=UPI003EE999E5
MNSALPPARDLPPGRQAEIRAELERAVAGGGRRRPRYAPLVTGVAVAAAVALVAVTTWQRPGNPGAASGTTGVTTAGPTTTSTPAKLPGADPVVTGLPPGREAEIGEGCRAIAGVGGTPRLYQYLRGALGDFALVYTEDTALDCTVGGPSMPYNSGMAAGIDLRLVRGSLELDVNSSRAGGDVPGNRAQYRGAPGVEYVAGRVSADVASVTWERRGETVPATVANGTFVAYVEHPSTWEIPETSTIGAVRAYDAGGRLLAEIGPGGRCAAQPAGCGTVTPWR